MCMKQRGTCSDKYIKGADWPLSRKLCSVAYFKNISSRTVCANGTRGILLRVSTGVGGIGYMRGLKGQQVGARSVNHDRFGRSGINAVAYLTV